VALQRLNFTNYSYSTLIDTAHIMGFFHDFGKATVYFQEYLNETEQRKKEKLKNNAKTHHSHLSALFAYYIFSKLDIDKNEYNEFLGLALLFIIKNHHSNPGNFDEEIIWSLSEKKINETIRDQYLTIPDEEQEALLGYFDENFFEININKEEFPEFLDFILSQKFMFEVIKPCLRRMGKFQTTENYLLTQFLYSTLLNSDKEDVIIKSDKENRKYDIGKYIVEKYKTRAIKQPRDTINITRAKIFNEVNKALSHSNLDTERIFSINVPTGTGKTLTALSFSLKLRNLIKKKYLYTPKIIYSLPFLSIIDQNFDVFMNVIKEQYETPYSDLILKHHHLSDFSYKEKNTEFDIDESTFLIEGWESELIVTTFFQFFHSLISRKNKMIRKFQAMANSIIILDEIQSIPHNYWKLCNVLFKEFCKVFNCYIIFLTATMPLIFDESKREIVELSKNKRKYYSSLNRVQFFNHANEVITTDSFLKKLTDIIDQDHSKNILIVLNTINHSKEVYDYLKNIYNSEQEMFYLSSGIIPFDRLRRIKTINEILKTKKDEKRIIVVSTQLIEAGVDIDFDIVIRDFAPLDSLIQTGGRTNRNSTSEKGIMHIFRIKDEKRELNKYIYSDFLLNRTKDVLKNRYQFSENKLYEICLSYNTFIKECGSQMESEEIVNSIKCLNFTNISQFKLIKEDHYKVDVFLEINSEAKMLWKKFLEIKSTNDIYERKNSFKKIKNRFYNYIVSVNPQLVEKGEFENTNIVYISKNEIENHYDRQTGFFIKSDCFL